MARAVVSMSTLGAIGLFGNQIFQYGVLRLYAERHGLAVETPPWIGQRLFGFEDPPISARRPVVTELEIDVAEALAGAAEAPARDHDLWGWYLADTAAYAARSERWRELFEPVPAIAARLEPAWRRLRERGRTVVGLHVRRGDLRRHRGHPLVDRLYLMAPIEWYRRWLAATLPGLDRPVVFLASDEPESVARELAEFRPVTAAELGAELPEAPFYPDFRLLGRCDLMAISNSTFSYAAAMLNRSARRFARPDGLRRGLVDFEPWAGRPLLELPVEHVLGRAARRSARREPEATAGRSAGVEGVEGRFEAEIADVRAIFGDLPRRGRLVLEARFDGGGDAGAELRLAWLDGDPAWSFDFRASHWNPHHATLPVLLSAEGRARGAQLDGPAWCLLAAAELPSRPGEVFVALTVLTASSRSFFAEFGAEGELRPAELSRPLLMAVEGPTASAGRWT